MPGRPSGTQPVNQCTQACPPTHWIKIDLLKLDDQKSRPDWWAKKPDLPYPNEPFHAEITDGKKKGSLNGKGSVRYDNIPTGICQIQFTNFYKLLVDTLGPADKWPAIATAPGATTAQDRPTPTISVPAPKLLIVKQNYQQKDNPTVKPHRIAAKLGLQGNYDGVGELTVNQPDLLIFEREDDPDSSAKTLPWRINAADLEAGKTVYLQARNASGQTKGTVLTLTLQGGSIPPKVEAASESITCVLLQLDFHKARPENGHDPVAIDRGSRLDPGRFGVIHDTGNHLFTQRAMLVVSQAKPTDFKGKLILKPITAGSEAYAEDKEVPASGQTALTGEGLKFANDTITAQGKKFWIQGKAQSKALGDTGWEVELVDVPGVPGDRVTLTVLTIHLSRIQTTDITKPTANPPAWESDDDFSPRLNEKAKIDVQIQPTLKTFTGRLRIDFGRLNNKPKGTDPLVNGAFTLVSRQEKDVPANKQTIEMEWDGNSTVAVAQEFSSRTTPNVSGGTPHIPLPAIANGQPIPHGLYYIDQIALLDDSGILGRLRPDNVDLSVPILANLTFNGNWAVDLQAYGLTPFQADIEKALVKFGGRDYMIRNATLANRINVRFIANSGINNAQSILSSIGGPDPAGGGLFGSTPDGPAPLSDNLYTFFDGLSADITIFPSTFFLYNNTANVADRTSFHGIFVPLGVTAAQTVAAPGVAGPRTVDAAGAVTGACTAREDQSNVTVTLDDDGMATVVSNNPAVVPAARASAIQAALRAFVRFVGNTINHETAHGLGVASRVRANNQITISGTSVTSPLDGDAGAHNKVTNNTNIVDAGNTRRFVRRIEAAGNPQQRFSATNTQYLRDCIPFDQTDN